MLAENMWPYCSYTKIYGTVTSMWQGKKICGCRVTAFNFFLIRQLIAGSRGDPLVHQRMSVQHPQPLGDVFWSQGDCTLWLLGVNLPPNHQPDLYRLHSDTLAKDCSQSELSAEHTAINFTGFQLVVLWLHSYIKLSLSSSCVIKQFNLIPAASVSLFVEDFLDFNFKSTSFWPDSPEFPCMQLLTELQLLTVYQLIATLLQTDSI